MLVTVAYRSGNVLPALAADLARQSLPPAAWLIVDNSPLSAPTLHREILAGGNSTLPLRFLAGTEGEGFGAGCNRALDELQLQGWNGWVWLLNPDTRLPEPDLLERFAALLAGLPPQALVGTAVLDADGGLEPSGGWFDPGLRFRRRRLHGALVEEARRQPLPLDWLSGCSLALRPEAHRPPARFDPAFPLYYEDFDLCLRLGARGAPRLWSAVVAVGHSRGTGSAGDPQRRLRLATTSYWRFLQRHTPAWVRLLRGLRLLATALARLPLRPASSRAVLQGLADAVRTPIR